MVAPGLLAAQDLEIQNLGWGMEFNEGTGIVSNVVFKPAEGDGSDITDDFVIALMIENQDDNTVTELMRQTVSGGIAAYNAITADNWGDINLNDYGLSEGSYLLLASVDTDDDISETNEDNNSMYLALSADHAFAFTPSGGTTGISEDVETPSVSVYPNPATSTLRFEMNGAFAWEDVVVRIHDQLGREVFSARPDQRGRALDVSSLRPGPYIYSMEVPGMMPAKGLFVKK